jgi:hypothetical protein
MIAVRLGSLAAAASAEAAARQLLASAPKAANRFTINSGYGEKKGVRVGVDEFSTPVISVIIMEF